MINFYRKIRRKLADNDQLLKYTRYAIGEIILVVIGILIALYINNLNTDKQEFITLKGYLNNISENIEADQIKLERIVVFRDSSIIGSEYFMNMIERDMFKEQYSIYFSKYFKYNPWLDESFQSDNSGFEALKNSGYLSKLQQTSLETELYKYYNLVEKIRYNEKSLNNFMEEMKYDIYKNNIAQTMKPLVTKIGLKVETNEDIIRLQRALNYPSVVGSHSRNSGADYLIDLYKELLVSAVRTQKEIEKITE